MFSIRGPVWFISLSVAIILKSYLGGLTPLSLFVSGSLIVATMEVFRVHTGAYIQSPTWRTNTGAEFLCTSGPYAYVRNPLYVANMARGIGVCIAINEWYAYALFLLSNLIVFSIIIPHEERFLEEKFGETFLEYKKSTRRFIPRLRRYGYRQGIMGDYGAGIRIEIPTILIHAAMLTIIYLLFAT